MEICAESEEPKLMADPRAARSVLAARTLLASANPVELLTVCDFVKGINLREA